MYIMLLKFPIILSSNSFIFYPLFLKLFLIKISLLVASYLKFNLLNLHIYYSYKEHNITLIFLLKYVTRPTAVYDVVMDTRIFRLWV